MVCSNRRRYVEERVDKYCIKGKGARLEKPICNDCTGGKEYDLAAVKIYRDSG